MAVNTRDLAWEAGNVVGVPFWVMWGVQGMETSHGTAISTSSGGAMGLYQFTAANKPGLTHPYPMVNSGDPKILAEQSLAAAQYLHYLYTQAGSWDLALWDYSGHGYREPEVRAQAKDPGSGLAFGPLTVKVAANMAFGPAPGVGSGLVQGSSGLGAGEGDPPDHSPKVKASGDKLGKTGTSFSGHARAMRNLAARTLSLKG